VPDRLFDRADASSSSQPAAPSAAGEHPAGERPAVLPDRASLRRAMRTTVVWDVLRRALDTRMQSAGRRALDVLDAGGGTGGFAVPLAELGHHVTVVDPSPDALAALERRAAEAGVTGRIRAVQGDTATLPDVIDRASVDVAMCHGVLEHVDDPAAALRAVASCLRPGATVSILGANRYAAVLARAVAGHLGEARHALDDSDGRWGPGDPMPRRFAEADLRDLVASVGLDVAAVHGVRVVADLVPGPLVDGEPGAPAALLELESALAEHPAFRAVASQIHLLAVSG
jgi:SAM-dependent methyltransferase